MPNENYTIPQLRSIVAGYGLCTPFGTLLPPGGQVAAYVRSTGSQNGDDAAIGGNLVATLSAGLARVRSGFGDTVYILPGHSESVVDNTMLANLVPGTKIVGVGRGSAMPTFRWTTAAASWLLNKNDVVMTGLRLRMEGFNGVTNGLVVSGADCLINDIDLETSSGASNKATTAIQLNAGADRFEFIANRVRGTATGATTDVFLVNAAVDSLRLTDCEVIAPAAVGNGVLRFNALATNVTLARNLLCNTFASATSALTVGAFAVTGAAFDNRLGVDNSGATALTIITVGSSLIKWYQNYAHDGATNTYGIILPGGATS